MRSGDAKTTDGAGFSRTEDVVEALSARLEEEVRHAHGLDVSDGFDRDVVRWRLRNRAEHFWPVTAERPLDSRSGMRGRARRLVKSVLRKLMRWNVEPFAEDQRAFNDSALKLVDQLYAEVDLLFTRQDARLVGELEERLTRLERRIRGRGAAGAPSTVAGQPAQSAVPDYFAFESRMRGPTDEIRRRQKIYVDDFRDATPVLDVGCGRGELLALLREAGIEARGVDADADMVAYARGEGLDLRDHQSTLAVSPAKRLRRPDTCAASRA